MISLPVGPTITGLEATYEAGDQLRANCSAFQSLPPVSLIWYINKVTDRPNIVFLIWYIDNKVTDLSTIIPL